jgi:hypothetical protein
MMQQQMQQQDEALDHISIHVDRIKHTGQLMHEELEEQVCVSCRIMRSTHGCFSVVSASGLQQQP